MRAQPIAESAEVLRNRLSAHSRKIREELGNAGFILLPGETPIIVVMTHDAFVEAGRETGIIT